MNLRYFKLSEFDCAHSGENRMDLEFLERLDELRHRCKFRFTVTSGYRSPDHPIERAKETPGTHARGIAADIYVANGVQRRRIIEEALKMGFGGVGVADNFVHIDMRDTTPVIWTYDD